MLCDLPCYPGGVAKMLSPWSVDPFLAVALTSKWILHNFPFPAPIPPAWICAFYLGSRILSFELNPVLSRATLPGWQSEIQDCFRFHIPYPIFKQHCDLTGKCMLSLGIGVHKSLSLSRGNQQIASELASLFICIEFSLFISLWLIFITSHSTEPDFMLSLQVQFNWSHEGSKILLRRRYGFMQWYKL